MGSYSYTTTSGRNNGTWNNQTGYGCVNAYEALKAVNYISGPSTICSYSNQTYTLNLPSGATVSWTKSSHLSYVSGQGTASYTVLPTGNSTTSADWVKATIAIACGETIEVEKEIYVSRLSDLEVQTPTDTINGLYNASAYAYGLPSDITTYVWSLSSGTVVSQDGAEMIFAPDCSGTGVESMTITVRATNSCGTARATKTIYMDCSGSGLVNPLSVSPNPTTGETTISLLSSSSETTDADDDEEWELEVYSNTQTLKAKKTRLKGREYRLSTSGWKEGVYIVRVLYHDEILTGKLVVKR